MAPKRTTRANSATTTTTTTTFVSDAQLEALIEQGVANALAARDADRNTNGDDNHVSGIDLKKRMTDKYCARGKIKKLESKLWNFREKSNNVVSYNHRFQELALLSVQMFLEEADKIERYVGGLLDVIHESVLASRPKTMQEAIEISNQSQQQQNKRQNIGMAYTAGSGERNRTKGLNHCAISATITSMVHVPQNATSATRKDCPKFKNNNRGTQGGNSTTLAKVYVVGRTGTNPDSNVVTGTFLLNNHYAFILFDTGADRSFVSTAFSSQIAITPTTLYHYYDVELADRRIIRLNSILRGCTLNFLNHPFNIDLMPVELGSFDAIIGMDWLAKYHVVIVCAEKVMPFGLTNALAVFMDLMNRVCMPYLDEFMIVFIDDSLIYSKNKKEYEEHLKAILELLKKEELYAKFSKCEFWIPKVQFLGHVIDSQGIHIDTAKIESIKDWASPKTPTEIRQILGIVGYYRRFIEGFSKIAKSMTKLTQKGVKFDWGEKQEAAFQLLKQKLCSAPVLALPEGSEDFWSIVMLRIRDWVRNYLYETKCMVFTDHKSLQHILYQKELNMRQRHWLELLSDYDCDIRYHPRKANVVADALSWKEKIKPIRVRALVMTIGLELPKQTLNAHTEAQKPENIKNEDVGGILVENSKDP
nr:putative reverse transcriptase domain-containing protein [Tanacetum cinerariifolium]